ncbi:MAG: HEAT repeat domain-containing protein [Planctomycetes bacterium]|nr:HEAT repeat domain-containing protein [Planctomycetota bacterium]
MSLIRTSALRLLVGASLFTFSVNFASAQDAQTLLDQGMSAYHQGNYDLAKNKFREIVASNPANADALQMLHNSEDALLELLVAGGEFEAFAREILAAARTEGRETMRDEAAAAAAAEGCFSESYADRAQAIFALSQNFGPFGAVPLVAALGDANESKRLAAVYALSRMGSNAMLPVLAATHSTNVEVRLGTLHVLNALGDARGAARILDMAQNDENGSVQAMASSLVSSGDPASAMASQGLAYFNHDPKLGLASVENYGVLWTIDGRNLQAYDLPQEVVELEMAKHCLLRAMELGANTGSDLALVYASEVAVLKGLVKGGSDLEGQLTAQNNALLTISHENINQGLHNAVAGNHIAASEVLIGALDGAGGKGWSGLQTALASSVPSVSHSAAIALAHQGDYSDAVIHSLASALALDAQRVVHIIDQDERRASELAAGLAGLGIDVIRAADGANGLVNMNLGLNVDAFVLADPLTDLYASRVIKNLRMDPRFGSTPVFVYSNESNGDLDANVVESLDAATISGAFLDLDAERARYIEIAASAAKGLAHAAHDGHGAAAVAAMTGALGRDDMIAKYAAHGLGFAGDGAAAPALANLVADTTRNAPVRAAAASALANLYSRSGVAVDAEVFQSAMMEGDAELAEACARAIGVMAGGHLSAGVSVQ